MTRLEALRIAIKVLEEERMLCSSDRNGLIARKEYADRWHEIDDAIQEVKHLCQEMMAENARKSIAGWQMDIMAQQENRPVQVDMRELDQGGGLPA